MVEYSEVPASVIALAEEIVAEFHPVLKGCRVGFVFFTGDKTSGGKAVIAKTSKVTSKLQPLLPDPLDFVIEINQDWYHVKGEEQRRALIDHELSHICLKADGYGLRAHDIEEFTDIIARYGLWNQDLFSARDVFVQMRLPLGNVVSIKPDES